MKKVISFSLFCLLAVVLSVGAIAQEEVVINNNDGVAIKYSLSVDGDNYYAAVVSNNYSGRVVVPSTVTYNGQTYTVYSVGSLAFGNRSDLTYVHLPNTIGELSSTAFKNSNSLDTLRLDATTVPYMSFFNVVGMFGQQLSQTVHVVVPNGTLKYYRAYDWRRIPHLMTDASYTMVVKPSNASIYVEDNPNTTYDNTFYYEPGDTMYVELIQQTNTLTDSLFLGWSNGSFDIPLYYVVNASDTLTAFLEGMAFDSLRVNTVGTPVNVFGRMGYYNGSSSYFVPSPGNSSPLYANGLWLSGADEDSYIRSAISKFMMPDFLPGPLRLYDASTDVATCRVFNKVWSVSRAEIDDFIAHIGTSGYTIPDNIMSWPGNGPEGYAEQLAPYYDANGDRRYDPRNGDYPLIRGDRMLFAIFNDAGSHHESGGKSMGVEVHVSVYAFDEPDYASMDNTVFVNYRVFNRSLEDYSYAFLGAFTDIDLGYGYDDFIGCDVRRGMYYAYNGKEVDGPGPGCYYGIPPAQGCIILGGATLPNDGQDNPKIDIDKMRLYFPTQLEQYLKADGTYDTVRLTADADQYYPMAWYFTPGEDIRNNAINGMGFGNNIPDDERFGMSRFVYYENSSSSVNGEPTSDGDYYNYLSGFWKNGIHMKYGGNAISSGTSTIDCNFMFPNDSDPLHWGTNGIVPDEIYHPNDWTEITSGDYVSPGDRRGLASSGPFTFESGTVQNLDLAYTTAFGSLNAWSSVEALGWMASEIRYQFFTDTTYSGKPFTYMPYSAPIVSIAEPVTPQLKVYPNPAKSMVTVNFEGQAGGEIALYDITGRQVRSIRATNNIMSIDISDLPSGVYFLRTQGSVARIVKR